MESALRPGRFIRYGESFSFVQELERVAQSIDRLVATDAMRGVPLYETFLAGCYEKSNEIDDSSGSFGDFMQGLCCRWIRARQTAGAPADDTVSTLLRWKDKDRYGYTYELEGRAVEALDAPGRAAFAREARSRFEEAGTEPASRREWAKALREVYRAQKDALSYVRLCREVGTTPQDCVVLADLFDSYGESERALSWARRGLSMGKPGASRDYDLRRRETALLRKLGRSEEALGVAWKDFSRSPHSGTYEELMACAPESERETWRGRAMERALTADLYSAVDLFLETGETEHLLARLDGAEETEVRALGHPLLQKAARRVEKSHPARAARLYRSLGLRIVDEAKSKYYRFAIAHLARARKCYERAGLLPEWEETVLQVKKRHRLKSSFMPGFENLVKGVAPERSSFLDRARRRFREAPED